MERRKLKNRKDLHAGMKLYSGMENGEPLIPKSPGKSNLEGDKANIALLFFLYTLQGIPLGLSAAIPMILQNHGVSYKQQVNYCFKLNQKKFEHLLIIGRIQFCELAV